MKILFTRKLKIALVSGVAVFGLIYLTCFTRVGLEWQCDSPYQPRWTPYQRFLASRIAAMNTPGTLCAASGIFHQSAVHDLNVSLEMIDRAIALDPNNPYNSGYYLERGKINMRLTDYKAAKEDFEHGLNCWHAKPMWMMIHWPSQADISNSIIYADGCLEAHKKALESGKGVSP